MDSSELRSSVEGSVNIIEEDTWAKRIFYISKYFGIFPFKLTKGFFHISIIFCVLSTTIGSIIAYITISFLVDYFLLGIIDKTEIIVAFFHCLLSFLYFIVMSNSFFTVKYINRIILELSDIDYLLFSAGSVRLQSHSTDRSLNNFLGAIIILSNFLINTALTRIDILVKFNYFILFSCIWLSASQFSSLGVLIVCRANKACEMLNCLRFSSHSAPKMTKSLLLSSVHNKLCYVCSILDSSFSRLLFFFISVTFFGITICLFLLISSMLNRNLEDRDLAIIYCLLFLSLFVNSTWQVVWIASKLSSKLAEFNTGLYQLMMDDKTNEILRNDKLWLHITMKREVVFTACGFFKLDYTLIHSMIASATTYLVILIQFGQSSSDKPYPPPDFAIDNVTTPLPFWSTSA